MSRTASRAGLVRRSRALAAIRVLCPPPLPITAATHEAALVIAGHTGYAIYDALIIASALEAGCGTLLSEDLQDGQLIDGRLTVRNPFAKGIEAG
jgi:predicted nucleic acid-binding protein